MGCLPNHLQHLITFQWQSVPKLNAALICICALHFQFLSYHIIHLLHKSITFSSHILLCAKIKSLLQAKGVFAGISLFSAAVLLPCPLLLYSSTPYPPLQGNTKKWVKPLEKVTRSGRFWISSRLQIQTGCLLKDVLKRNSGFFHSIQKLQVK